MVVEEAKVFIEKTFGKVTIARDDSTTRTNFTKAKLGLVLTENEVVAQLLSVDKLACAATNQTLTEAKI